MAEAERDEQQGLEQQGQEENQQKSQQEGQQEGQQEELQRQQAGVDEEQEAKRMGWVSKEDFRGDPDKHRSAKDFLDRGRNMIPILNKRIRDLQKREVQKDKSFTDYLNSMRDKLHAQRLDEHEDRKRQAVADGDSDTYDRLAKTEPKNELPEYKPPEQKADPVFDEWADENNWYNSDYERHQEAVNYGTFLNNTKPDLKGRDFLNEVSEHVRDKFSNPNRDRPSAVDSGTQKASIKSGKLFDSLDAEAKAVFNGFVRERIFKNNADDREAYAKDVLG